MTEAIGTGGFQANRRQKAAKASTANTHLGLTINSIPRKFAMANTKFSKSKDSGNPKRTSTSDQG